MKNIVQINPYLDNKEFKNIFNVTKHTDRIKDYNLKRIKNKLKPNFITLIQIGHVVYMHV